MSKVIATTSDNKYMFYCEGCQQCHAVNDHWNFNKDYEKPTFSPSILVRGTKPITDEEHALIMAGVYVEPKPFICHSFVVDGKIEYLSDCTHGLAGQTVGLKVKTDWFDGPI